MNIKKTHKEEIKYYMSQIEELVNSITTTEDELIKSKARKRLSIVVEIIEYLAILEDECLAELEYDIECIKNDEEEGD